MTLGQLGLALLSLPLAVPAAAADPATSLADLPARSSVCVALAAASTYVQATDCAGRRYVPPLGSAAARPRVTGWPPDARHVVAVIRTLTSEDRTHARSAGVPSLSMALFVFMAPATTFRINVV
jgi:hypothetical protein